MTTKDKAKELVEKYTESISYYGQHARQHREDVIECAKIAVDELMETMNNTAREFYIENPQSNYVNKMSFFWQEVKNELNKML